MNISSNLKKSDNQAVTKKCKILSFFQFGKKFDNQAVTKILIGNKEYD